MGATPSVSEPWEVRHTLSGPTGGACGVRQTLVGARHRHAVGRIANAASDVPRPPLRAPLFGVRHPWGSGARLVLKGLPYLFWLGV